MPPGSPLFAVLCVPLQARMKKLISEEVKAYFRPELLNRFDEQIVFHKLGLKEVRKIADLMLEETRQRVAAKGVQLVVGKRLFDRIVRDGYSLEYGVRPLRQVRSRVCVSARARAGAGAASWVCKWRHVLTTAGNSTVHALHGLVVQHLLDPELLQGRHADHPLQPSMVL